MQNQDHKIRAGLYLKRDVCGLKEHTQCAICNTQYDIRYTIYAKKALTLLEMVVAMAIIAIIFAAVLPQFRAVQNSWDSKAAAAEVLQNGRVLIDHLNRNLSKAVRITSVSGSAVTSGYIEFEDNDGDVLRYDVAANNYVEYGQVGSLSDLAGPVSKFQLTCCDACDLDTPITDVNSIRFINVETTLTNSSTLGQDRTYATSVYLRTNWNSNSPSSLIGWWKLDETSGLTAEDSSGNGNDANLINMAGNEWITGWKDGALEFDGYDDYIDTSIVNADITYVTFSTWFKSDDAGSIGDDYVTQRFITQPRSSGISRLALGVNNNRVAAGWFSSGFNFGEGVTVLSAGVWYHAALIYDGSAIRIYLNGLEENSFSESNVFAPSATDTIQIGRQQDGSKVFDGVLDDVRIYNRALEPEDVALLVGVVYQEFTEAKSGSDTTSLTISTPTDTTEGDLLIAAVATDGDTASTMAPPGGEGWTEIHVGDYISEATLGAWWKIAGASESPGHQFTWSQEQQAYAWMMRFTGHDPDDPIDDWTADGESSSSPTSPAVTTDANDCLILRLGGFDDGDITVDAPGLSGHIAITMDQSQGGSATYREFTEKKGASDGTSLTIDTPSGTGQGDLLIAVVATDASETISPPAGEGWTQIDQGDGSNQVTLGVWWKIAGASESSTHEFTWGSNEKGYGWMMRFTGHDPTAPINASAAQGGNSGSPECLSVDTTVANALILRIGGFDDDDITVDSPGLSGHTPITMDKSSSGSGTCSGGAGYKEQAAIGSSGIAEFSLTETEQYRTVTIAIAPDSAGGSGVVSGGAGYVRQSASGDSGTSTFSLTASEQSRALTIAIAPEPGSVDGGGTGPMLP